MPEWLDTLYDSECMSAADRWAIEEAGIPSLDLMETAGRAVADRALEMVAGQGVTVVCGKGNNGGDGLVAARHLARAGVEVEVVLLWPGETLSPDASENLSKLEHVEVKTGLEALTGSRSRGLVIDAILGTGFEGEPREPVSGAITWINEAGRPVLACDVPSGVDASTGEAGLAVQADSTITFHGAKVGHFVSPGKRLTGRLTVAPIGIPADAPPPEAAGLIDPAVLDLLPPRTALSTKFTSGRVTIVGGSRGLTGAVTLASTAAIRAGAGYATAAVPVSLEPVLEAATAEVMTMGCEETSSGGALGPDALGGLLRHCDGAAAVVIGSGMGRDEETGRLARELTQRITVPLVVDADALGLLAGDPGLLAVREAPTVLTPHAGEMGRLLGIGADEVDAHRLGSAARLAGLTHGVAVLKGDDTIVRAGDRTAINDLASPGLATAGTGDVLAGICGAFLARGLEPFEAASAAVLVHSRAGRIATLGQGTAEGVIASDVVDALPGAMSHRAIGGRGVE